MIPETEFSRLCMTLLGRAQKSQKGRFAYSKMNFWDTYKDVRKAVRFEGVLEVAMCNQLCCPLQQSHTKAPFHIQHL